MQAIKKINNNVALCIDGAGRQVIAMGKGIGFHTMPCEIPLENIDRTFYDIDESYAELFRQISPNCCVCVSGSWSMPSRCCPIPSAPRRPLPWRIISSSPWNVPEKISAWSFPLPLN